MLFGSVENGGLEVRRSSSGVRLRGRFPYGRTAVLSDGGRQGRPRKEIIAPRAFSYRVDRENEEIHLLAGHSYDRPLASRGAGTLLLRETDEVLTFEANITQAVLDTSHGRDVMSLLTAGLAVGISPGFRLPPARAVAKPERIEEEEHDPANGKHRAIIRTVTDALLYELSIVTLPAYGEATVEMRNWTPDEPARIPTSTSAVKPALARWRL